MPFELGLKCFTALLKLLLVRNEHNSQDFNPMLDSVRLISQYTSFLMTQSCQRTAFSWHTDDTVFHLPSHYSSHGLAGAWGGGHLGVSCRVWHQLAWRCLHCQTTFLVRRRCAVWCATLVRYVCSTVVATAACLSGCKNEHSCCIIRSALMTLASPLSLGHACSRV